MLKLTSQQQLLENGQRKRSQAEKELANLSKKKEELVEQKEQAYVHVKNLITLRLVFPMVFLQGYYLKLLGVKDQGLAL